MYNFSSVETEERPFLSLASKPIAVGDEITCDYGAFCAGWSGFGDEAMAGLF